MGSNTYTCIETGTIRLNEWLVFRDNGMIVNTISEWLRLLCCSISVALSISVHQSFVWVRGVVSVSLL
jgi:hypothetical protein